MPPRKSRATKSAAPSPSPARTMRSRQATEETVASVASVPAVAEEDEESEGGAEDGGDAAEAEDGADTATTAVDPESSAEGVEETRKPTAAERMAKLKELRLRMNESTAANRRDLVEDHQKSKVTARELVRLEKQKKLAQTLRLKADADASGEDLERRKAWEWSIEQNERWEKKMEEQKERADNRYKDDNQTAHKKYHKDVRGTKPDLVTYARQKEAAMGLEPGSLAPLNASSDQLAIAGPSGLSASEDLYRGANTLSYGDSKPSEDAIDRVVGKINKDMAGTGRKRTKQETDTDVTYINKRNKVFNKKVARYFDKYTSEIRENLERGTAL